MKKQKKKNYLINITLILIFLISLYNMNKLISNKKEIKNINKSLKITKVVDDNSKIIYKNKFNKSLTDYTNMSMIKTNLNYFIKKNPNTVGFIYIPQTKVKHVVMNDEFYLNHNFNKNKSYYGLPYIYNKNKNFTDKNNIIVTKQKTFNDVLKKKFLDNDKNLVIKVNSKENVSLWQIVSIYKTKSFSYKTVFKDKEFANYKSDILLNNEYNLNGDIDDNDKLLTIVIEGKTKKVIVAKLIKMQVL